MWSRSARFAGSGSLTRPGLRIRIVFMRILILLFTLMRIRIRFFTVMWVRILPLIKMMRICDLGSIDLPGLDFEPPRLYFRPHDSVFRIHASIVSVHGLPWLHFQLLKLLDFDLNANLDPYPAFYSYADPDQAFQNNADACGTRCGPATLLYTTDRTNFKRSRPIVVKCWHSWL